MKNDRKKEASGWDSMKKKLSLIWRKTHLAAIFGILLFYILCCVVYWFVEYDGPRGANFLDILLWNTATLFGQDFADHYPVTISGRLLGIVLLLISMFGVSAITGYISSALVENNMNSMRGMRKLQRLKNHVIICGWKSDLKFLIQDIIRKNKEIRLADIVLVNNVDETKIQTILMDADLKGIQYVRGDYSEEAILRNAKAEAASKALILGENQESMEPELVDSRVFAAVLMLKGMNPKLHACAEVLTKKYKNYLEAQKCDEVIYSEEYTRYILSTATNYNGMAKVLSALFDNGDGVSIQILKLEEVWYGKTFSDIFQYYKEHDHIMVLGILANMGAERALKHSMLAEAQKSTNYGEIVAKLKDVRNIERNEPILNPPDDYVLGRNMGLIVLGEEI